MKSASNLAPPQTAYAPTHTRRKFDAKTTEWHRSQLMKKLAVQSAAELANYAVNEGLTCAYA